MVDPGPITLTSLGEAQEWAGAYGYGSYYSWAAACSFSWWGLVHIVIDFTGDSRRIL